MQSLIFPKILKREFSTPAMNAEGQVRVSHTTSSKCFAFFRFLLMHPNVFAYIYEAQYVWNDDRRSHGITFIALHSVLTVIRHTIWLVWLQVLTLVDGFVRFDLIFLGECYHPCNIRELIYRVKQFQWLYSNNSSKYIIDYFVSNFGEEDKICVRWNRKNSRFVVVEKLASKPF